MNNIGEKDLPKRNSLKFHRNATIDSTTSSLKLQKIKTNEGITPLIKITKKTTIKNVLDFPICMSLYSNSVSTKETKEKPTPTMPINRGIKLSNLNQYSLKNILALKKSNNIKNELILPLTKKIISRNSNSSTNNIIQPINSDIKNYLFNINNLNFQSSRNISKPKLKKIQYNKLSKFTQRTTPGIKLIKKLNINKKDVNTKKTYDFEQSEIKNNKTSFGGLKFDLKNKTNAQDENKKTNKIDIENNNNNNKIGLKIGNVNESEKNKNINNNDNNIKKQNLNENKNEIKNLKSIISDKSQINKKNEKNKANNNKVPIGMKFLNRVKINDNPESKNNKNQSSLAVKDIMRSTKRDVYNLKIYDHKSKKIYSNKKFLNKINAELSENPIIKKINTKIYSQKSFILTNIKDSVKATIIIEKNKLYKYDIKMLTISKNPNMKALYIKKVLLHKNKLSSYIKINTSFTRKLFDKYNCYVCYGLRDYLFRKNDYNRLSIVNIKEVQEINHQNNLIQKLKSENKIKIFKRHNTFMPTGKNIDEADNLFSFSKSKAIQLSKQLGKKLANFIIIQEFILKSLPFYKEEYNKIVNNTIDLNNRNSTCVIFDKKISKKYDIFDKKSSFSSLQFGNIRRIGERKTPILKLENIRETLRIQNAQKTEAKDANLFLLKNKTFFKKGKIKTENDTDELRKESSKSSGTDHFELNERNAFLETIYFQLMKSIFEGKTKYFINYFVKNKKIIDINQVLSEGNTLLILAVKEGNNQIVKFLCEYEADLNIQNNEGNTALHYALGKHFYSIADILTKYGAIEDILNSKGLTPWDCIERKVD